MGVREELCILSRIVIQTGLRFVYRLDIIGYASRFLVSLLQGAFAFPTVLGMMLIPERIIHRPDCSPEYHVVGPGMQTGSGHPLELREYILFTFEPLPVRRLMCTKDRRIVLGTKPWAVLVGSYGLNIV